MSEKWSREVTEHSNAMDLKQGVFTLDDPTQIAKSLIDSAEHSNRRKGSVYESAMSMLNLYINRAGKNLPADRKATLNEAKEKLKGMKESIQSH